MELLYSINLTIGRIFSTIYYFSSKKDYNIEKNRAKF